ncbi:unnamed protein product, partial [Mesorhabditis belari]|uniref:Protein kinase domain-containing protein n=1 Tax=Mesorhabditis belari TaxID=2138241 RepID=A0AAF3EXP8_9BILA
MHRDLTPRNIGINQKEFEIKLLDFGLARETRRQLDKTGTDIRAVALVILELLGVQQLLTTGSDQIPSHAVTKLIASLSKVAKDKEASILRQLTNENLNEFEVTWRIKVESRLDPDTGILKRDDFKDLLKKMQHFNSKRGPSAVECLNHGFLKALNLKYEPKKNEYQETPKSTRS